MFKIECQSAANDIYSMRFRIRTIISICRGVKNLPKPHCATDFSDRGAKILHGIYLF